MKLVRVDEKIISLLRTSFIPTARLAIFLIYFWFGILKIFDLSPAGPIAESLVEKTVGAGSFNSLFLILGVYECIVGILFLFPKLTRLVIPLLLVHLLIVSSPLLLVPDLTWDKFVVPTLEGQYIIKNIVVIALALGIAAQTTPYRLSKQP